MMPSFLVGARIPCFDPQVQDHKGKFNQAGVTLPQMETMIAHLVAA
jgi:hypothetical protein